MMSELSDEELQVEFARLYWAAECRWQTWRKAHPDDARNGLEYSGSLEEDGIAADWRAFKCAFDMWERRHPAPVGFAWGVNYPSHRPFLFKNRIGEKSMTPEQRIAALKAHYLDVLVENAQDGSETDIAVMDALDRLLEKTGKPKQVITLDDLPLTRYATKHPDAKPGFTAVGKSVTHIELLEVDGVLSPCFTEFCKCRSEAWAGRVSDALNLLYPDGKIPEV